MTLDLLIPFGILLVLVIYLIYTRGKFEKNIVNLYEKKFEEWKNNSSSNENSEKNHKELVGLVFKNGYKVSIELMDQNVKDRIQRGKFEIKEGFLENE